MHYVSYPDQLQLYSTSSSVANSVEIPTHVVIILKQNDITIELIIWNDIL